MTLDKLRDLTGDGEFSWVCGEYLYIYIYTKYKQVQERSWVVIVQRIKHYLTHLHTLSE